jgi:hypothetical protein
MEQVNDALTTYWKEYELRKEGRKCRGREIWEMKERRNTKYIEQRA